MKKIAFWAIALLALSTGALGDTFKVPEEEKDPVYVPPYGLNHSADPLTTSEMGLVSVDDGTPPTAEWLGFHGVRVNLSDIPNATIPSEIAYGHAGDIDFNTSVSCNTTHCVVTLKAAAPQATMAEWKVTVYNRTTTKYGYDSATVAFSAAIEIAVCPCGTVQIIAIPLKSELMSGQDLVVDNFIGSQGGDTTINKVVNVYKGEKTGVSYYSS